MAHVRVKVEYKELKKEYLSDMTPGMYFVFEDTDLLEVYTMPPVPHGHFYGPSRYNNRGLACWDPVRVRDGLRRQLLGTMKVRRLRIKDVTFEEL